LAYGVDPSALQLVNQTRLYWSSVTAVQGSTSLERTGRINIIHKLYHQRKHIAPIMASRTVSVVIASEIHGYAAPLLPAHCAQPSAELS